MPALETSASVADWHRERFGSVGADGITECVVLLQLLCAADGLPRLPAEYKQLEGRVDALRDVHQKLLKITKVHESESVSTLIPPPSHH
jgi:hypothetical protein